MRPPATPPRARSESSAHAGVLRLVAAKLDRSRAAAALAGAAAANPDYLEARLVRVRLLAEQGDKTAASAEWEAVSKHAASMGLSGGSIREVDSVRPR
jgi:hypothetical protein